MRTCRILYFAAIVMALAISCESNHKGLESNEDGIVVMCHNGRFRGTTESTTGVIAFKGIPYAMPPTGELRWKAPVRAENNGDLKDATAYGLSSIQYYWHSEPIRTDVGENCLSLNVWTSGLGDAVKPIMVFFHGGSFAWGGSSENIYDGQHFVQANPDIVLVTCNYRVGIMGFANFDAVPGGEDYPDSDNLGILDAIMSLEWIKENIGGFGGNPDNVTVFGESAGGGLVAALLATHAAGSLFHKAIIESGGQKQIMTKEQAAPALSVKALMAVTGASTMEELCALSEKELIEANETPLDDDGTCLNDMSSTPVCGTGLIASDLYAAMGEDGVRDVDILIGTNSDEMAYWVNEMGDEPLSELDEEGVATNLYLFEHYFIQSSYERMMEYMTSSEKEIIGQYLARHSDLEDVWAKTRLIGDVYFRAPSIRIAEEHSGKGSGRTYMYLFGKRNDSFDFMGSCHAAELPYVFMNTHDVSTYGNIDMELAHKINAAWASFARTGSPAAPGIEWPEYDIQFRKTMIMGDDGSLKVESDPYAMDREQTMFTVKYSLLPAGY